MTMMHHITLSNGVFAACGVVCKPDPTPKPSLGEGAYRMRPECGRYFTRL